MNYEETVRSFAVFSAYASVNLSPERDRHRKANRQVIAPTEISLSAC
jgi:hypothetical protein